SAAVDIEGTPGLALADDLEPTRAVKPWAAFLPSLDPTVMGWTERGWYLGDHTAALFDRNGNAGPSIWWNGRVVGGWAWRKDGTLPYRLLEDVGREAEVAIGAEAERIRDWIGPVTFVPRFPTPLQRELAA
ncbi:MAG: winged helix DNA-binding domain-containing protein, partial [Candidatus Dormibacteraeota bacterium]|nr:winged helix DNA-binding domain-containing protein [Candidatus Dormibacteraeota bacterium]